MIETLITLLVIIAVAYGCVYLLDLIPGVPAPIRTIGIAIVVILALVKAIALL